MSNIHKKLIDRLTDNYSRGENTNISKIMKLSAYHIQENEDLLHQISEWRDIDQAEGVTLDYIGRNIGQDRMGFNDNIFRVLLKSRIIRNNSDGSIPTIIRFLSFILEIEKQIIRVQEKWRTLDDEPVGLHIEIDIDHVLKTGISPENFGNIVNELVPAGIHADIYFVGSFMFSDYTDQEQIDSEHGFGETVSNVFYYPGDFMMGEIGGQADGQKGFSNFEDGRGGKFGAYFRISGFKDGTNDTLKTW
ncbi:DUF2612 domain-containing protein [Bacillus sp. 1663tsa1]|uniref:DUF2612 domain-containing protein n=1 Tax=Bacillus sp. 1663tsa1 TaxID=2953804 RepID=UPI00209F4275|nr:DUF2612 domain-containing protein [Bacillus sp. 1663tsa1]MCP1176192.1 DUF2612 domain-containing protein [Bacillus sp. 1663tsa1]